MYIYVCMKSQLDFTIIHENYLTAKLKEIIRKISWEEIKVSLTHILVSLKF